MFRKHVSSWRWRVMTAGGDRDGFDRQGSFVLSFHTVQNTQIVWTLGYET
jgi:hypothetical protein